MLLLQPALNPCVKRLFLGKPVLMVPTEGHFEQECNALDACDSLAGIANSSFNLTFFMEYTPNTVDLFQNSGIG